MKITMSLRAGKNEMEQVRRALAALDGRRVNAGVSGPHAWLARIHEFGCNIGVTPKMRAFLHGKGVHLKKETTLLVIPERAFLRHGYDAVAGQMGEQGAALWRRAAGGGAARLEQLGHALAEGLRAHAKAGAPPPRKAFAGRRGGTALTDTGAMLDGIGYEIEG